MSSFRRCQWLIWVRVAKRNSKSLAAACWPVCALLIGLAWIATGGDFGKWFWVALLLTTAFGALNLWLLAQLTGTPMSLWSIPSSLAWSFLLLLMTLSTESSEYIIAVADSIPPLVAGEVTIELSDFGPVKSGRQLQEPAVVVITGIFSSAFAGLLTLLHFIPNRCQTQDVSGLMPLIWGVILPLAGYLSLALFYVFATPLFDRIGGIWPAPFLIGLVWYAVGLTNVKLFSWLAPVLKCEG